MSRKYKQKFKDDVTTSLNCNLNFDTIKDKIIIDDNTIKNLKGKGEFPTRYHTQSKNRLALFNWKVLSVATSILLIFTVSLIYFTKQNKPDYKISPFSKRLEGAVFGKQISNSGKNSMNLSLYIDSQHEYIEPNYFYEVNAKGKDNYYTCAYFPTKYNDYLSFEKYFEIYSYMEDASLIDGKLIAAYQEYFEKNNISNEYAVKWYQVPINKDIPHQINDYSLGLVLGSQDITFIENKTTKEKLNLTKKIFYRNFYDIDKNIFNNDKNEQYFLNDLTNLNILISKELITDSYSNNIREIIFENSYKIINNDLEIPTLNKTNKDGIGEYKIKFNEIKTNEYFKNNILYYTYNYDKFCEIYLKK